MNNITLPHGGKLIERLLSKPQIEEQQDKFQQLASWSLRRRQLCDLELLLNGAFSPLEGFMGQDDYQSVLNDMRLANGLIWPMPITLDVSEAFAKQIQDNHEITLRDQEGNLVAFMQISDIWQADKIIEANAVFGTDDITHPGVNYLLNQSGPYYVAGRVFGISLPKYYDFKHLRYTPSTLRKLFAERGWQRIVGFQTRNPMHRAHQELTLRAAKQCQANILINPVVGMTKPGDIDHYTRVRCYEKLLARYPTQSTFLSILPLAMRMAGPREALWHAIIRKNYGCSHFIVGRDHAGPGFNGDNKAFYGPYDAQALVKSHQQELGIEMVPFQEMVYLEDKAQYCPINEVTDSKKILKISGTEFRHRLQQGIDIPEWFSYPEIITELRRTHPAKHEQGFTIFFTGLPSSGKSTLANALLVKLMERGGRSVTLLDGDLVRKKLSSGLNFSKEHRNLNVERIGYVASEITKHRGIAICAPIAPYQSVRQQIRTEVTQHGGFLEVYLSTPLAICEQRDPKGLYAKARAGEIKQFTGIDDPYEIPANAELTINTAEYAPEEAVDVILAKLADLGYINNHG